MNLLSTSTIQLLWLAEYDAVPLHAALSSFWDSDDLAYENGQSSSECEPVAECSSLVKAWREALERQRLDWLWADAVCADGSSSAVLSDSINSLCRWYSSCTICLASSGHVCASELSPVMLAESSWIQRTWTLVELIGPQLLQFYDADQSLIANAREAAEPLSNMSTEEMISCEVKSTVAAQNPVHKVDDAACSLPPSSQPECDATSVASTSEEDESDETDDYEDCLYSSPMWDDEAMELNAPFADLTGALAQTALDRFSGWLADCERFQEQSQPIDSCDSNKRIKSEDFSHHTKVDWKGLADIGDVKTVETPGTKRWACPYAQSMAQDSHCITRTDLRTIRDLKQHLCMNHRQPYYCPTCGTTFPRASERDNHITSRTCSLEEWKGAPRGLSQDQLQRLARRCKPGTSEINQWYDIWSLVHSGDGMPPPRKEPLTPYLTGIVESAVCLVRDFWIQKGKRIIADLLEQRGLRRYEIPDEERNLAAMYQVTLNHVVDSVARTMAMMDEDSQVDPSGNIGKIVSSICKICLKSRVYQ